MTARPTDVVERLEQWGKLRRGDILEFEGAEIGNWHLALQADIEDAIAEIRKLRNTTERCSYSPTGLHVYAKFPMGPNGRILTVHLPGGKNVYPAGSFCQHCNEPEPLRSTAA